MGVCSRFMQEAFFHWALDGTPNMAIVENDLGLVTWPWYQLCDGLSGCDEGMPDELCEWFGLPRGASYGAASMWLLRGRQRLEA